MTEQVQTETLYCYRHPTTPTTLRCNRCERPICSRCAILTPTGYRCPECIHQQQRIFNTAVWYDYILGFGIAFVLSLVASLIFQFATRFGIFGFIAVIFGGPIAGGVIAQAVRFVINRRRARSLFVTIGVAATLGALPVILYSLFFGFSLYGLIFQGIYLFTGIPTLFYRLSGIRIGR
jgi:hypothetical protein